MLSDSLFFSEEELRANNDTLGIQTHDLAITDFLIDISKKRVNEKMVYTVPFFLGRVPGMHINLVLATDCEWTYISGKNCSVESGCSHGVYDHHMTTSEQVDWTLIYSVISD